MRKTILAFTVAAVSVSAVSAQPAQPEQSTVFAAGLPFGVTTNGVRTPMSSNVKVYGGVVTAESCSYHPTKNLIMAINRGADPRVTQNDGFVSLLNHDGSVHTPQWIGATRAGLVLNQPSGSDVHDGKLYIADRDGGGSDDAPSTGVVRMFDLNTGAPVGEVKIPGSTGFNDIAVTKDGTIYGSQTSNPQRIYKVTPDGQSSIWLEGAPLARPNGVAIDTEGNIVILNVDDTAVLTYSPAGQLLKTEHAPQTGSDGLVIMPDGTKYISSVFLGGISRIRPGQPGELIATGVPSAASMCFDPVARQLVIPMTGLSGMGLLKLN